MNKTELVAAIAENAEISKKDAEKAVKAFVEVITEELKKGEKVQLVGFGTFEVTSRAAREDRQHHEDCCLQGTEVQSRQGFEGCCELIRMCIMPA